MKARILSYALIVPVLLAAPMSVSRADNPAYGTRTDSDSSVSEAVRAKITAQSEPGVTDLKVLTDRDGTVHLSGRAGSAAAAERAVQLARSTMGVRHVRNEIVISADPHG